MNNSDYRINVDATVTSAQEKLNSILEQFKQLERMSEKSIDMDHVLSGNQYDKAIKLSRDLTKNLKELYATYEALGAESPLADAPGVMRNLAVEMDRVKKQMASVDQLTNNLAGNMSRMSAVDRTYINEQQILGDTLSKNLETLQKIKRTEQDLKNARARVSRTVTRSTDTGRIDYNNFKRLKGELGRADEYEQLRVNNTEALGSLRKRRRAIGNEFGNLGEQMQGGKMTDNEYRNRISALKQERKEIDAEIKARQSLNATIKNNAETFKQGQSVVNDPSITKEPSANSLAGILKSRAFAISVASLGAGVGAIGSIYNKGKGIEQGIRSDAIQIGQQVGTSDYRGYKRQIASIGMQSSTGYTPEQMMDMAGTVLGGQGNLGQQATLDTTEALAKATRSVAVDSGSLQSFIQSSMKNGSVSGADGVTAISKSIAGAISAGGMGGRDDEVLKALQEIADNTFAGRNGSSSEMNNVIAMNTMLNATGDKAVQGDAGAKLQADLSSGIRNLGQDNPLSLWLGKGTQYQGLGGMWNMQKMQEKGLTANSLNSLVKGSSMYGSEGSDAQKMALYSAIKNGLGVDVTTDQVDSLMKVYKKTSGDPEAVQKEINKITKAGKSTTDKNSSTYSESAEGSKNLAEAVKAVKALEIADNKLTTAIDKLIGKMSGLNAMVYAGGAGLLAGGTMLGGSVLSAGASSLIKSGKASSVLGKFKDSSLGQSVGSTISKGTSKGSSVLSKLFGSSDDIAKAATEAGSGLGTATAGGATSGLSGFSKIMSKGGGLLKGVGKVALPIGALASIYNVATAKDKTKAVGGEVGGWAGALGGATAGAGLGSMILPGVGTVIGGAVGGIAGSLGGTALGEGAVNLGRKAWKGIKGFFGGEKVSADEIDGTETYTSTDGSSKKLKNASSSQKTNAEQIRKSNNAIESKNLTFYEELLIKAQNILKIAKAQNGIYGNGSGSDTSSGGSSSSGGGGASVSGNGSLSILAKGKYWSTDSAKTTDLGTTVSGVTADSLNKWIASKTGGNSGMDGLGSTFIKAGEESGLDPRYLVAHAGLESGWGSSQLSKSGNADTGNWFGIGAFDSNPSNGENYGLGIVGGAKWIADNYYKQGQTTVDSMRNNNGVHQYATDPNWDEKIASIMESSKEFTGASKGAPSVNVTNQINVTGSDKATATSLANKIASAVSTSTASTLNYYTKEKSRV